MSITLSVRRARVIREALVRYRYDLRDGKVCHDRETADRILDDVERSIADLEAAIQDEETRPDPVATRHAKRVAILGGRR